MKIIDIRIEVDDDLYREAWNVAERAADGIGEALYEPTDGAAEQRFAIGIFDASEEQETHVHKFWTTGGAWRCDCGAMKPRMIGPGV